MRTELPSRTIRVLTWGLVFSCVLVVLSTMFSALEVSRARKEVLVLFRQGERATYLLGHAGKQLAIIQATLRNAAAGGDEEERAGARDFESLEREVQRATGELSSLLGPGVAQEWSRASADLERVVEDLGRAARAIERGDARAADAALDETAQATANVLASLASLAEGNRNEIEALFAEAERRLRSVRQLELVLGGALLLGLLLVWAQVIRLIWNQQRALDEHVRRVEAANAELDAFAGRVAHDLRNAFGPLRMAGASVRRAAEDPDAVRAVAERLETATRRAMTLLDGMLAFSRAGKPSDPAAAASVADEVRASLEELAPLAERVGATIDVIASDDLRVSTAPGLLHVVVGNVLNNALKFLEGRERRVVRIAVRAEEGRWGVLSIEDTGPGIPDAALQKLFQPFYRVPGTKIAGTGIGLATVDRIVRAHGGHVRVASVAGAGTRFEIRLPLSDVEVGSRVV